MDWAGGSLAYAPEALEAADLALPATEEATDPTLPATALAPLDTLCPTLVAEVLSLLANPGFPVVLTGALDVTGTLDLPSISIHKPILFVTSLKCLLFKLFKVRIHLPKYFLRGLRINLNKARFYQSFFDCFNRCRLTFFLNCFCAVHAI